MAHPAPATDGSAPPRNAPARRRLRERLRAFFFPHATDAGSVAASPEIAAREIFRTFWPYTRPYRRWIVVSLVFVVAAPAVDGATLWLLKLVVDDVLVPRDFGALVPIAAAFLALSVLDGILGFLDDYTSTWVSERFLLDVRDAVFRHLSRLSLDFFELRRLGDVQARLTSDIGSIETFMVSSVADTLSYVVEIVIFVALMLYLRWELALAALTVAPLLWLITRRFNRMAKQASRQRRRRTGGIAAIAEETFSNIALVQAYGREERERERFHREAVGNFAATMAATRVTALFAPLTDLVRALGMIVVVGMGTWEVSRGRLSLGGLLVFLAYLGQLYSPIRRLARLTNTLYSAAAAAERVIEFLRERPSVRDPERPRRLRRVRGRVELDRVGFRYPGSVLDALTDVSFEALPGETVALVGPSGAGKSTVAKLLLRFYDPTRGAVRLDGADLRTLALRDLRAHTSLLLQESLVFDETLSENIAYGRPGASRRAVERAARAADAHGFIERLPSGYDERAGQKGRRLSGGQRQRVAIARAMVRNAPLLVLDEPTSGLDAESMWRILDPMRRLMAERTTIVISHNLLTVRDAARIVVLDGGRVVETGTHEQLLRAAGRYADLYRRHVPLGDRPASAIPTDVP